MEISKKVVDIFESFSWNSIFYGLPKLNHRVYNEPTGRFMKAGVIERVVAKNSKKTLTHVNLEHCDFASTGKLKQENVNTVELKSLTSERMYLKNGKLCKTCTVRLTNTLGVAKKTYDPKMLSDILLVVYKDGAFIVDLQKMERYSKIKSDCVELHIPSKEFIVVASNANELDSWDDYGRIALEKFYDDMVTNWGV
jgi:hypothetical protein